MNKGKLSFYALLSMSAGALLVSGCTSGTTINSNPNTQTGSSFVVGTDAPLAAVTSFSTVVQSVVAVDASNNQVNLISGTPTVDFARFNGLQTLLDMNDVPAGTYNQIIITLGTGTIGYLDTSGGGAPTLQSIPASFTTSTITKTLANPLIIAQGGAPVGIRMDFDLAKSVEVTNGQVTGTVTPTFDIKAVTNSDPGAYIDEFDAAVVSVNTTAQSFVVQGPHGRQFTGNVNGQTEWDGSATLSALTSSSIVQISGELDRADATIDADEVAILTDTGFYAGGQVTYVNPSSGPASSFDLYVRGTLPTTTGIHDGDLATIDLSGSEKFSIYWAHGPLAQFLFNQSSLLAGQHVAVGGPASGAANESAVSVKRVMLRAWGFNGTVVPASVNTSNQTFQMQVKGFAGVLIPQTVTVYITNETAFRDGFNALGDVSAATNVRVVGLLLKDPLNPANTVLVGRYVDDMD